MQDLQALTAKSLELLERLVAFDTTSRRSNLELIDFAEGLLKRSGAVCERVANDDGSKANLIARIGPAADGGIMLSGHTDVVPVDGQLWTSDPWILTERDGRLYGRGAADMKGFLALALAAAPDFAAAASARPVQFAFSYDEEIGCLGAPHLIEALIRSGPRPAVVVVGEPTNMEAVSGHKGISTYRVTVTGKEAHSSLTHLGVSAVMAAIDLMARLKALAEQLEAAADPASPFTPKGASLTIGQIHGGTAVNILARECVFLFDLRCPPGFEPATVLAPFMAAVSALDAELKARAPGAGAKIENRSSTPPLSPERDGAAEEMARGLVGDNGPTRAVSYAAEAGQFQQAGFSTVICGPGSIEQAHQPDEYIELSQMQRGAAFMARLTEAL